MVCFLTPLFPQFGKGLVARGGGGCGLMARWLESSLVAKGSVALVRGRQCLWHAHFKIKSNPVWHSEH